MWQKTFDRDSISRIITLHDEHLNHLPENSLDLYESSDAVMWDGYIKPILELHAAIDSAFRFNQDIEPVDIAKAYEPNGIENLNLAQIGFVFRDILVHEKFIQGLFVGVIMDGRISRLVNRLKVIVNS